MAKAAKAKSKKRPKRFDKEQSERFKEIARELGADESMEDFRRRFPEIAKHPIKNNPRGS
jgi:hypothetical protein